MNYLLSKLKDIEAFLSERNFWLKFVFPTVMAMGILPYINEQNADALSQQAVVLVQLIMPVVGALLLAFTQSHVPDDLEEILKKLLNQ